jgi:hypothetical protein
MYNVGPRHARAAVHDDHVSFLKFLFDSDYAQRRDIEELREMQYAAALNTSGGGASEKWVGEIADEVKELAATVRVLLRQMAEAKILDMERVRDEVAEELRPKRKAKPAARPAKPPEPAFETTCTKCKTTGLSTEMVRIGADWLCRPCARNP